MKERNAEDWPKPVHTLEVRSGARPLNDTLSRLTPWKTWEKEGLRKGGRAMMVTVKRGGPWPTSR